MRSRRIPGWADYQAECLRDEGVQVNVDAMGEHHHHVDLAEYGWFPDLLRSKEATDEDNEA